MSIHVVAPSIPELKKVNQRKIHQLSIEQNEQLNKIRDLMSLSLEERYFIFHLTIISNLRLFLHIFHCLTTINSVNDFILSTDDIEGFRTSIDKHSILRG